MSVLITLMTVTNVPTVPTPMVVLSATADQDYKEMGEFVSKKHDYFWPADQP